MDNYQKLYHYLLKNLSSRTRNVIERRFGLQKDERETLESIGESYGVCRERVRQIEEEGISLIKKEIKKPVFQEIFNKFENQLRESGDLKREDLFLSQFSSARLQNQALFWLTLGDPFCRHSENEEFYSFWTVDPGSLTIAQKIINYFTERFKTKKELISPEQSFEIFQKDFKSKTKLNFNALLSYLEISKKIEKNSEGLFGLAEWPEVTPRGIKDRAFLALKKNGRPLHFTEVAKTINQLKLVPKSSALPQTVHNELIRDPRFVLVGRGIYALKEWGYFPGQVRDVILKILKESKKPLSRKEVIEKVLSQRLVKENTILLNLQNKKYFLKDLQGRYTIKEA